MGRNAENGFGFDRNDLVLPRFEELPRFYAIVDAEHRRAMGEVKSVVQSHGIMRDRILLALNLIEILGSTTPK